MSSLMKWKFFLAASFLLILASFNLVMGQASESEVDTTCCVNNYYQLSSDNLGILPFRGEAREYYNLFPGVIKQEYRGTEYLHVRGSRPDDIAYTFEGISLRSAYTGLSLFRIIPEALQSISLHTSPYASESNSGVLFDHRMKRGGETFHVLLHGETDNFTSSYEKRLGTYSYGYQNYLLAAQGKLFSDNVHFFIAGEGEFFDDSYRKFWDGFTLNHSEMPLIDSYSGLALPEILGVDKIEILPGNIPNANSDLFALNGVINATVAAVDVSVIGLYNWRKKQLNGTPIRDVFNSKRIPVSEEHAGVLSCQIEYTAPFNIFTHTQIDYLTTQQKTYDPLFGDNFMRYRDSLAIVSEGLMWGTQDEYLNSIYYSYLLGPDEMNFNGFLFRKPGDLLTGYSKSKEDRISFSMSAKKRMKNHLFEIGGAYQQSTIRKFSINNHFQYVMYYFHRPENVSAGSLDHKLYMRNYGEVDAYGYDVYGTKIDEDNRVMEGPRQPRHYSFFVQDAFSLNKMDLVLGLRYDNYSSDALRLIDPANPGFYGSWNGDVEGLETVPSHGHLQPRLSISIEASEKFSVGARYGKYVHQVRLSDVYSSRQHRYKHLYGGYFYTDPVGTDAEPVLTTQYQMDCTYHPSSHFSVSLQPYYRVIDGHLETTRILTSPMANAGSYLNLTNSGETIAKGVELLAQYNRKEIAALLNYTFSEIKGYTSNPHSNIQDAENDLYYSSEKKTGNQIELDYNQTHRINALASYRFLDNSPKWLKNTTIHAHFRFNSGHDFTLYNGPLGHYELYLGSLLSDYDPRYREKVGRITTKWNYQVDMRLDRTFRFGSFAFTAYCYVQNIFNRKNEVHVYWRTGKSDFDDSYTFNLEFEENFRDLYGDELFYMHELINLGHRQHYAIMQGGDLFGRPREIRFGLQVHLGK